MTDFRTESSYSNPPTSPPNYRFPKRPWTKNRPQPDLRGKVRPCFSLPLFFCSKQTRTSFSLFQPNDLWREPSSPLCHPNLLETNTTICSWLLEIPPCFPTPLCSMKPARRGVLGSFALLLGARIFSGQTPYHPLNGHICFMGIQYSNWSWPEPFQVAAAVLGQKAYSNLFLHSPFRTSVNLLKMYLGSGILGSTMHFLFIPLFSTKPRNDVCWLWSITLCILSSPIEYTSAVFVFRRVTALPLTRL
jgi:hypothetical protein